MDPSSVDGRHDIALKVGIKRSARVDRCSSLTCDVIVKQGYSICVFFSSSTIKIILRYEGIRIHSIHLEI